MSDDDHLQPSDFGLDRERCPPCYDGAAKEFLLFAAVILAFVLGVAIGMKVRDGQLRHARELPHLEEP
jgi:hypothetical protein